MHISAFLWPSNTEYTIETCNLAAYAHLKCIIRPRRIMHKEWLIIITVHKVGVLAKSFVGRKGNVRPMLTQGCNPSPMANLPVSRSKPILWDF
jgi:hypothetical protein